MRVAAPRVGGRSGACIAIVLRRRVGARARARLRPSAARLAARAPGTEGRPPAVDGIMTRISAIARHIEFEAIDVFELHTTAMVVCWMLALARARSLCLIPTALEAWVKA